MKKLVFASALVLASYISHAQQLNTPQPSPTQTVKQNFSTGSIELSYSRPAVKGRKVFGDLVPFDKVWRTGANNATTISFTDDVTIGGKEVKAGKYGLLSIPGAKEWTLIITKDVNVNQPALYKQENDVVRVAVKPMSLPFSIENFTILISDITGSSCQLQIMWDKTLVTLPVTTNTDARVMKQIEEGKAAGKVPYFAAASYYYETGKDMKQAKEWVDKAIAENKDAFWMTLLQARIAAKLGDKATAKASATKTVELATKAENGDYVKMANDLLKSL